MIQLIRLTDILFAVQDSFTKGTEVTAVGSLLEAKSYLKDFHGVDDVEVTTALTEMDKLDHNAADFGVTQGLFMYTSNRDVAALLGVQRG